MDGDTWFLKWKVWSTQYEITKQTRSGASNPALDCHAKSDTVSLSLQILGINSLHFTRVNVLISEPGSNKLDKDLKDIHRIRYSSFFLMNVACIKHLLRVQT